MVFNESGEYAKQCWCKIPVHFPYTQLDEFIVMPNHIHGIIRICNDPVGANNHSPLQMDHVPITIVPDNHSPLQMDHVPITIVPDNHSPLQIDHPSVAIVPDDYSPLQLKSNRPRGTSKTIGSIVRGFKIGVTKMIRKKIPGVVIWQNNYFEHIIRNENALYLIRKYIRENPLKWYIDHEDHIDRELQEAERANDYSPQPTNDKPTTDTMDDFSPPVRAKNLSPQQPRQR